MRLKLIHPIFVMVAFGGNWPFLYVSGKNDQPDKAANAVKDAVEREIDAATAEQAYRE